MNKAGVCGYARSGGGSELVMTRRYLGELEAHFVVVNWDQPGGRRLYNAVDISALTTERYAYELTQILHERFQQEKSMSSVNHGEVFSWSG